MPFFYLEYIIHSQDRFVNRMAAGFSQNIYFFIYCSITLAQRAVFGKDGSREKPGNPL